MQGVAVQQGQRYIAYNSEIHRLRRADVQYTSPLTMLFAIVLVDVNILVIRLYIDLRITQAHAFTLSVANMPLALGLHLIGILFKIR